MGKKKRRGSGFHIEGTYVVPEPLRELFAETWQQQVERRLRAIEVHIQELAERLNTRD